MTNGGRSAASPCGVEELDLCRKLLSEVSNYLDDDLDPQLRLELERHMKACPECWVVCDTTRRTIQIFRGNEPYPMPDTVKGRLYDALRRRYAQR